MSIQETKTKKINKTDDLDKKITAEMTEAGVLYGHNKSKTHPRMKPFIVANRHEIEILDPGSVVDSLDKAVKVMKKVMDEEGSILFVGTTSQSKEKIQELAESLGQHYVVSRWLGGTLTNFKVIGGRIKYYLSLKEKQETGELDKYTKKEQVDFDKEISKLSKFFVGLVNMDKKPDLIFVVDIKEHDIAVKEANMSNIPVVAIVDSNDNPTNIDHPIIANDHSRSSIGWVIDRIKSSLIKK